MKPTQEQVVAWAREAGIEAIYSACDEPNVRYAYEDWDNELERFAALAYEAGRKDENEAATDRELMQMALDALEWCYDVTEWPANGESTQDKAIEALRARLSQPEPKPLWIRNEEGKLELHAPPQREWQGLTDEEIREFEIWLDDEEEKHGWNLPADIVKYIEAKLKEKNSA
jgi:hypothetical protein